MNGLEIGIIGGTRGMGRWFADFLQSQGYSVHVSGQTAGMKPQEMASHCQIIVVSVPISVTIDTIATVGPLLRDWQLFMDLTSLKVDQVKAMLKHSQAEVIGCHPLFGPQTISNENLHVVLCPARTTKWLPWLHETLEKGKVLVIETTPERHDEIMTVVQGLNHLNTIMMGMALSKTSAPLAQLDQFTTPFFDMKADMVKKIIADNPRLHAEIICSNPKMAAMIKMYGQILDELKSPILRGDAEDLTDTLQKAASLLWPSED